MKPFYINLQTKHRVCTFLSCKTIQRFLFYYYFILFLFFPSSTNSRNKTDKLPNIFSFPYIEKKKVEANFFLFLISKHWFVLSFNGIDWKGARVSLISCFQSLVVFVRLEVEQGDDVPWALWTSCHILIPAWCSPITLFFLLINLKNIPALFCFTPASQHGGINAPCLGPTHM